MIPLSRPILWWLLLALAAQPLSAASALETSVLRPAGLEESSPDTKREFRTALGGPALPPSLNGTGGLEERQVPGDVRVRFALPEGLQWRGARFDTLLA